MDRQPTVLPTATPSCGPNIVAGAIIQIAFIVSVVVLFEEVKAWTHSVVRKPDGTLTHDPEADKRVRDAFGIASSVLVVFVGELFCCASARYLRNIKQDVGAYAHVDNVRRSAPVIRWVMQCWHWERETYHETETDDSTGNTRKVEKHRTVRKDTWLFRGAYSPYYWEDISSPFPNFGDAHMTRLRFRKCFVFADQQSAYDYQQEQRDFIRQRHMDVHYDFKESFDIGGYRSHVLACKQVETIPWWIGQCYYYLASILCCSVPYHLLCYHDPNCLSEQSEICLYLALPVRLIMYLTSVAGRYRIKFAQLCCDVPEYRYVKRLYSRPMQPIQTVSPIFPQGIPVLTSCAAAMGVAVATSVVALATGGTKHHKSTKHKHKHKEHHGHRKKRSPNPPNF
eukprot:COSAG01_NODE_2419_length_7731_cov_34.853138_1_plen_396_part_10